MSFPPSLNFVGEIIIIIRLFRLRAYVFPLFGLVSFFGGVYCLYIYRFVQHGIRISFRVGSFRIKVVERLVRFLHLIPLSFIFLLVRIFTLG